MLRRVLVERLQPAVEEAHAVLETWREEVTRLAGDPETVAERSKAWHGSLDDAKSKGFLAGPSGGSPDGNISQLAATLRVVDTLLSQWDEIDLGRRIAGVAKTPWARLEPTRDYLDSLEAMLQASIDKAKTQGGDVGADSPVTAFENAIEELRNAVRVAKPASNG
jgi:hypothetical protein